MPVARIVTHISDQSPEVKHLSERLQAEGYDVVIAPPGSDGAADLVIELDALPAEEALDAAARLARESDADIYIAPGLFPCANPVSDEHPQAELSEPAARFGVVHSAIGEVGRALHDSRAGIRDSISGWQERAWQSWTQFQRRSAAAARERRLDRERRALEREQRRQEHELELQRRAEEKQRIAAEQERAAAERERAFREQAAREAAMQAEMEQRNREEMAREAARRAEIARAEERERIAAIAAERLRLAREQEALQLAAMARQPESPKAEEIQRAEMVTSPSEAAVSVPAHEQQSASPAARPRTRLAYRPRRMTSRRERQWQRAAFVAAVATLAAMLGFALAARFTPSAPIPQSVQQNRAEQQVPFGPARMDVTRAASAAHSAPQAIATKTSQTPSAARPAARRRPSADQGDIAEDEVIVHHLPNSRAQRAQAKPAAPPTDGVRRFSDEN